MNDGNAPKQRSWLATALPFVLILGFIAIFAVVFFSGSSSSSNQWTLNQLEYNMGYALRDEAEDGVDYNGDGDQTDLVYGWLSETEMAARTSGEGVADGYYYTLSNFSAYQNYKATTLSGSYVRTYVSTNERYSGSFYVVMDNETWTTEYSVTPVDHSGVTVTHGAFNSLISSYASSHSTTLVISDAFASNWWSEWGSTIIYLIIVLVIGFLIFSWLRRSINGSNNAAMNFNKSPARRAENNKVKFADVAGCDAEKAEMVELVEYLKDPKKYSKYGARLPKGVLLIGPPGTGKTLLAKAVAGEAGVPFYSISGSDFVEMYVGVGAGRVRDLFKKAKASAPCLIFIDEIDAVGRQRGAGLGGGNDEREQTLNQLLVEMDGFETNAGILVIAATNRDDILDPALRRAGRFDRTITVSMPDKAGREAILKVHARNKKLSPDIDFGALAKRTVGFSGADLESILNDAAILAVRGGKETIGMTEIDEAIDRAISGPAKTSRGMTEHERKTVAYHEAGHAVIGLNLPHSDKVQKITIVPRGNTGGHVLMTPEDDRFLLTRNELIARITGLLGGRTSEEIFFGDITTGASNDIQEATRLARMMVTELGMSELGPIQYENASGSVFLGRDYTSVQKNFSDQVAVEIDKAVRNIIDTAHEQARELLTKYKDQVILIAETLLERETITAEEIDYLLANGKLPDPPAPAPVEAEAPAEQAPVPPSSPTAPEDGGAPIDPPEEKKE